MKEEVTADAADEAARRPSSRRLAVYGLVTVLGAAVCIAAALHWAKWVPGPDATPRVAPAELPAQLREYLGPFLLGVAEEPENAAAHAALGLVYEANERWGEARDAFAEAARLDPAEPLARYHLALVTFALGERDAGLEVLRSLVRSFPDFAPGQHRLGVARLEEGDRSGAEAAFRRTTELAPSEPAGLVGLADVKLASGDAAGATLLLERALALKPADGTARHLLATAYRTLGRTEEAEREFARVRGAGAQLFPDEWTKQLPRHAKGLSRQMARALAHLQAGRPAEAIEFFEGALVWHPENVDLMNNLAIAYLRLERAAKARDILLRAARIDAEHWATRTNLAVCHLELDEPEKALSYAERAAELAPAVARAHGVRATCLLRLQRREQAIEALERAAALEPGSADFRMRLGKEYAGLARHAEAAEAYEAAIALAPGSWQPHLRFAEALLALGRSDDARVALEEAERLAPADEPEVAALAARLRDGSP